MQAITLLLLFISTCVLPHCKAETILCPLPAMARNIASVRVYRASAQRVIWSSGNPNTNISFIHNDSAIYECKAGFALQNIHEKYYCDDSGRWTGGPPMCIPAHCQKRNVNSALAAGRRCRKACQPGANHCRRNLVCTCEHECGYSCIRLEKYCNKPPPAIGNAQSVRVVRKTGRGRYTVVRKAPFRFDDIAQYTCKAEFVKEKRFLKTYCHGRKSWTKAPTCVRWCKSFNARKVHQNNLTCGRACKDDGECRGGLQCLCDGYCGRTCVNLNVDCGIAPVANNASLEYTGEGFNQRAHYTCNDGFYVRSGSATRKCTGGGAWDGKLIICARVTCGDPFPAINAQGGDVINWKSGPYYVGTTFQFSCANGYELLGSRQRTCLSNGRWSGRATVCNVNGPNSALRCKHPGVPVNGRFLSTLFEFPVGSQVTFACDEGYALVGKETQVCLYFLQWSGNGAPLCVDPKFADSSSQALEKLQKSANLMSFQTPTYLGRFISASYAPGHEIYFIFDLSKSVNENELNNSLTFAIKLIERLTYNATGKVEYGIIVFASRAKAILDIQNYQPRPTEVIQMLRNIGENRRALQKQIRRGTYTALALRQLTTQLAFSYNEDRKKLKKRHVFSLTDGRHTQGPAPENIIKELVLQFWDNPPEFYSITSCVECHSGKKAVDAYEELLGLANNKQENFIFIPNFYFIQKLLDQVTDAQADFSACGRAGDVGSVKLLATQVNFGRVVHGTIAPERAWPWQVAISIYNSSVHATLNRYFRGGGSVINNRWVLTAAHLFKRTNTLIPNWEKQFSLVFGLHRRPVSMSDRLLPITKVFRSRNIFVHPEFNPYTFVYDVALMEIGEELVQNGSKWMTTGQQGWLNYTSFIRPVCLPCVDGNCVGQYLRKKGLLTGLETEEQRCSIETDFLLERGSQNKKVLAVITGFGRVAPTQSNRPKQPSEYLQQGLIKLESESRCHQTVQRDISWGFRTPLKYTNEMICGSSGIEGVNVDACQGDSGGPLVREVLYDSEKEDGCWVQVGIVSWGRGCGLEVRGSGRSLPGFYTNVSSIMPWVKSQINITQVD